MFKLELQTTQTKNGMRYPLWYRSNLLNTSCFSLVGVPADDLIDGPTFTVWDANGIELPRAGRKWNEIVPYSYDRKAFESMRRDSELQLTVSASFSGAESYHIRINPGRSVSSLPSEILPSVNWLQPHNAHLDFSIKDKSMAQLIRPRLRGKIPRPPPGFAFVDGYIFQKPGQYSIQAEFRGDFRQVMLHPRYAWYHMHTPDFLKKALDWTSELLLHKDMRPRPDNLEQIFNLHVRSNTVEFQVIP